MATFYMYFNFKENMEGFGLPAPEGLFGSLSAAVGNAAAILSQIDKFGTNVTIREIIGAGTKLEGLGVIGGCAAAFYVGAVIGSVAVASGRSLSGGTSIAEVIFTARRYELDRKWLPGTLQRRPEIHGRKRVAGMNIHGSRLAA